MITQEIESLRNAWELIDRQQKGRVRIFASKATILLAQARKCRDADHLTNLIYDPKSIPDEQLEADLERAREATGAIPDYACDCHTAKGRKAGKTKQEFFAEEYQALAPRQPGPFDGDIEGGRCRERRPDSKNAEKPATQRFVRYASISTLGGSTSWRN
jgi:hypothetical protein